MTDPTAIIVASVAALAAITILSFVGLKGWRDWIGLQTRALTAAPASEPRPGDAGARIELADLKERVRKLEAIAAGVDL